MITSKTFLAFLSADPLVISPEMPMAMELANGVEWNLLGRVHAPCTLCPWHHAKACAMLIWLIQRI